jgi:AraC family transcriptional regulator, transcriptional activator of pobA
MSIKTASRIPSFNKEGLKSKGFKVHALAGTDTPPPLHGRRDFYKIVLVTGDMTLYYGGQTIEIKDTFLFFANPHVPHTVVHHTEKKGYACLFTEAFIAGRERNGFLQNSPLFRVDGTPIVRLNSEQATFMTGLYQKMVAVYNSNYDQKDEMLKSCVDLIIHEALRIQPPNDPAQKNAAARITRLFMETLEKQFPIETTAHPLRLRTAQDYATTLAVHVNYLNRSVKEVTGKPISVHIADRIAAEAKALLQYTSWSVADIADGLGFEYPTYFNNYFKRVTGVTPNSFRKSRKKV